MKLARILASARLLFALLLVPACLGSAWALDPGAAALRDKYAALKQPLANNPFKRPLVLESTQDAGDLKGDVYAIVEHPYASIESTLTQPANWCQVLILHLNIKQCRNEGERVIVNIGRKFDQPIEQTYQVNFDYRVAASGPEFMQVRLSAADGPLGTRDYRIVLAAVPLDAGTSFIHMAYSYGYGFAARVAMQGYLATIGADKVGFSVTGRDSDGKPLYIGGVRGVVERNTMRYYLAIDAYLGSLTLPKAEQQDKRLRDWFAATERYATQLHEMSESDYLQMKQREVARQSDK
jgi:hypothetical protein